MITQLAKKIENIWIKYRLMNLTMSNSIFIFIEKIKTLYTVNQRRL